MKLNFLLLVILVLSQVCESFHFSHKLAYKLMHRMKYNSKNRLRSKHLMKILKTIKRITKHKKTLTQFDEEPQPQVAQEKTLKNINFEIVQNIKFRPLAQKTQMTQASIYLEGNDMMVMSSEYKPQLKQGQVMCASASYGITLATIGWDKLYVETYSDCDPVLQVWAAGYLEGFLTFRQIRNFYDNLMDAHKDEKASMERVFQHFREVEQNIRIKLAKNNLQNISDEDDFKYTIQIGLMQAQTDGMLLGHNSIQEDYLHLRVEDLYTINADGEIPELMTIFAEPQEESYRLKSSTQAKMRFVDKLYKKYKTTDNNLIWLNKLSRSHCSALVKLTKDDAGNFKELFFTHSTWDEYSEMLRIFKIYDFKFFNNNELKSVFTEFSAYPGTLSSTDDYYIINQKLAIMETTLEILDEGIYSQVVKPEKYIPDFFRVVISNRLANNAPEWVKWLSHINTGTYNSQWMVVDYDVFNQRLPGAKLPENTFVVAEQCPGKIVSQDQTEHLMRETYWGSFNVPFYPEIRKITGFEIMEYQNEGDVYSYEKNPRSKIFRARQKFINNLEDVQHLMQSNTYRPGHSDPNNSDNPIFDSPAQAIASRFDIEGSEIWKNLGAIDTKIVSSELVKQNKIMAISGPTYQNQKVFDWNQDRMGDAHRGQPDRWQFPWVEITPEFLKNESQLLIQQ